MQRFETFVGGITEAYRLIQRIKSMEMAALGLSGRHVMCLNALRLSPEGLNASELSARCAEDKAAVSRTVAELKDRALVCRGEGYRAPIRLTPEGEKMADRVAELSDSAVESGGAGLTEGQRANFYASLEHICANLRAYCEKEEEKVQ